MRLETHHLTQALAQTSLKFPHRSLSSRAIFLPMVSTRHLLLVQMIAPLEDEMDEHLVHMIAPLEEMDEHLVTRASRVAKARSQGRA